ncbi:MAG: phosphopantothenoylcysteine decarboxylase [Candidatus Nealsonbacteria bacterium]|nr:MAG: phosphopantothenoylcysteine decarboxylase [Candidatus Nealsonbacteria bacterium]
MKSSALRNLKVLITAGATREYIDPIRFISNASSGKMGVAMAQEALDRKAKVTIVWGKGTAKLPKNAKVINVETTKEMCRAVVKELKEENYDVFVATAAAADYTPVKKKGSKIPSKQKGLVIPLKPTPKVIERARKVAPRVFICAFKAEVNVSKKMLIEKAYNRLKEVELDLMVSNDIGKEGCGFGVDTNEVYIINSTKKIVHFAINTKQKIAAGVWDVIYSKIKEER